MVKSSDDRDDVALRGGESLPPLKLILAVPVILWMSLKVQYMVAFVPGESRIPHYLAMWAQSNGLPLWFPAKAFHVVSYMGFAWLFTGFLAGGYFKWVPAVRWRLFWACTAVWVVLPEIGQFLNTARTPSFFDLGYNLGGVLIGLGIYSSLTWLVQVLAACLRVKPAGAAMAAAESSAPPLASQP